MPSEFVSKKQLYTSALKAYQNGEISTALSKLERFSGGAIIRRSDSEREAVYKASTKSAVERIPSTARLKTRSASSARKFRRRHGLCRELLTKYPNDGTFQALKIRIEDAERQELSSYTADVSKRLEAERDLDRRVNIIREACERYPNEAQFAQQLKLVRERRDLVNSIVVKARQYEGAGDSEAISQWDILRNTIQIIPALLLRWSSARRSATSRDETRNVRAW
jgi:hypothetical protein